MGNPGLNGTEGMQGESGEKGDRGPMGRKGQMGEEGEKGSSGEKGDTGADGMKGNVGDTGGNAVVGNPCRIVVKCALDTSLLFRLWTRSMNYQIMQVTGSWALLYPISSFMCTLVPEDGLVSARTAHLM